MEDFGVDIVPGIQSLKQREFILFQISKQCLGLLSALHS